MKKLLLLFIVVAVSTTKMNAQNISYGAKAGLNLANLNASEDTGEGVDEKNKIGFAVGFFAEIALNEQFSFTPELLYSRQGNKYESKGEILGESFTVKVAQNMDYVNVPLLLKYKFVDEFYLQAGPQVGFLVNAKGKSEIKATSAGVTTTNSETEDLKKDMNTLDFGLGVNLTENIFIDARYNLGLTDIAKEDNGDNSTKHSVFQFSLGYKF